MTELAPFQASYASRASAARVHKKSEMLSSKGFKMFLGELAPRSFQHGGYIYRDQVGLRYVASYSELITISHSCNSAYIVSILQ